MKHAIFIEPEGAVRDLIVAWKDRLEKRWPRAAYLSHPAHATVWVGEVNDAGEAARAVAAALSRAAIDRIRLAGTHIFFDDVLAGGSQTLTFAVEKTAALKELQRAACLALGPHVAEQYPFAGPNWLPHFTTASLPVRRDDPVIAEFRSIRVEALTSPCRLSWWQIAGDLHNRLLALGAV